MNPNAIHLLERNQDKIDWHYLSRNPNALHLLERNQDKIDWHWLFENPEIFEFQYDFEKMRCNMESIGLRNELMETVFDPERLKVMSLRYKVGIRELIQIY